MPLEDRGVLFPLDVPAVDGTHPGAPQDVVAQGREGGGKQPVVGDEPLQSRSLFRIPKDHAFVSAGREDPLAVGAERDRLKALSVSRQLHQARPVRRVPEDRGMVKAAGDGVAAVRAESDAGHPKGMAPHPPDFLSGRDIPEDDGLVLASADRAFPVGAEGGRGHSAVMAFKDAEALAGGRVPKDERAVAAGGQNESSVRAPFHGAHSVRVPAQAEDGVFGQPVLRPGHPGKESEKVHGRMITKIPRLGTKQQRIARPESICPVRNSG